MTAVLGDALVSMSLVLFEFSGRPFEVGIRVLRATKKLNSWQKKSQ